MFRATVLFIPAAWLVAFALVNKPAAAEHNYIVLQSTTSTQNSGLLDYLIPQFRLKTGIDVRVVAVVTGQALKNGRNGDGDVVLVHARAAEDRFVESGFGIERRDVMHNDFVVIGPKSDPAGIAKMDDASNAFLKIAKKKLPFVSRGDNSGTHIRERALWKAAGVETDTESGTWYREVGSGMGATLNVAGGIGAYTLVDRATWVSFRNKIDAAVLVQGDRRLLNPYGIILINPARHRHVNISGARAFVHWLTGAEGQGAIRAFRVDGLRVFHPVTENKFGAERP